MSESIANDSNENVDFEMATTAEVIRVMLEQQLLVKKVFSKKADTQHLTKSCRKELQQGIEKIYHVITIYVLPVLDRLALAFGGPENPRANEDSDWQTQDKQNQSAR